MTEIPYKPKVHDSILKSKNIPGLNNKCIYCDDTHNFINEDEKKFATLIIDNDKYRGNMITIKNKLIKSKNIESKNREYM